MKHILSRIFIILSLPVGLFLIVYLRISYLDCLAEAENAKLRYGTYIIDTLRTDMGAYIQDRMLYRDLTITFNEDMSFQFNKKVPFIFDSIGKWTPAGNGFEDWNHLIYQKKNKQNFLIRNKFSSFERNDSSFYINYATPDNGNIQIPIIVFKRVGSTR